MKKLLSFSLVLAMLLSLILTAAATDKPAFDTSVFEMPTNIWGNPDDPYFGIECWEPVELGLEHIIHNGITYYQWLNKIEKIPAVTEENGGCFTPPTISSATVVFWNGVPNLPKDMFKWWEGKTKDVYIPDSVTEIDEDAFVMNSTITLHFTANNAVALAYAEARGMNYEIMKDPVVYDTRFDTSVFEIPADEYFSAEMDPIQTYMTCLCVCSDYLGIYHYEKGDGETGEAYFKWMNKWETMPDAIDGTCFCGVPNDPYLKTVVFWNGVPNLVNDLFKDWEAITDDVYIPDSVTEIAENCFVEGSHITLHFTANNAVALAYAEARGMNYEIVPEPADVSEPSEPDTSDPVAELLKGDTNLDGEINMKDVWAIRWYISGMIDFKGLFKRIEEAWQTWMEEHGITDSSASFATAADVDGDGQVGMKDVRALRQYIAGLITI